MSDSAYRAGGHRRGPGQPDRAVAPLKVPILLYHSIADAASPRFRRWAVPPGLFAEHMAGLVELGYHSSTVERLFTAGTSAAPSLPDQPVVITFDDGFADFLSEALPILQKHRLSSTLYVTTAYLGSGAAWLYREQEEHRMLLDRTDLPEIAGAGVQVGAHSHTHPKLDELPGRDSWDEIVRSKRVLEDLLQAPVSSFAYPHGYHSPRVRRQVAEAGFSSAVGVRHAMATTAQDALSLSRIIVSSDTDVDDLDRLLRGENLRGTGISRRLGAAGWRVARRTRAWFGGE